MRASLLVVLLAVATLASGCRKVPTSNPVIAEGVLQTVSYQLGDGRIGGLTRLPYAQAVPGGNGSWKVNARGKLTKDFLIITYPDGGSVTCDVIPVHRLQRVQFCEAGKPSLDFQNTNNGHE